jgi:putative ABC transport system permease protein
MKRFFGVRRAVHLGTGARGIGAAVDEELTFHIEARIDDLVAGGMMRAKARDMALREFGDWQQFRSDCVTIDVQRQREMRFMEWLESVWSDAKYAWRGLRRAPGFTAVAVITIALGIGATTAIFSVVSAVLLRPLPYVAADRLVHVGERDLDRLGRGGTTSLENYEDWRRMSRSFEAMGLYATSSPTLTGRGDPMRLEVARVTAGIFDVFHVTPLHGRAIENTDYAENAAPIAVVGYEFWRSRLGGDPTIVGQSLTINLVPVTVVGIMPPGFRPPASLDRPVWTNFTYDTSDGRGGRSKNVYARLRTGISVAQAQAEMTAISHRLAERYPRFNKGEVAAVDPIGDMTFGDVRRPLLLLLGASAFVLLIACANLSNLLLARGMARNRELALRSALGAARGRTIRQLLTESVVLSVLGTFAGLALAQTGTTFLLRLAPRVLRERPPSLDARMLAFTFALSVGTAIAFGLFPALRAARRDVQTALNDAGARVAGGRSTRARTALAVGQLALALTLLTGSGLVLKSFARVLEVGAGIRPDHLLTASVTVPRARYDSLRSTAFYDELALRLSASPGIEGAAVTSLVPFGGDFDRIGIRNIDGEPERSGSDMPEADRYIVSPSYFDVMGIRLLQGRLPGRDDRYASPIVCVVDEVFARRVFNGKAIGRSMKLPGRPEHATIVGVVNHVKTYGLDVESPGQIYMSNAQYPWRWMNVVARTSGTPLAQSATLSRVVHSIDRDQPVAQVSSMEEYMATLLEGRRFTMALLALFAIVAVAIATVGLYGVIAYGVTQRRREIGVRVALGARRAQIAGLIVRDGVTIALVGAILGGASAMAMGRTLSGFLFEVSAHDPTVLAIVSLILMLVALAASWVPARRALLVDPTEVLRGD